ncbi:MAG: L-seryl-tRNA(Sec) selenium transferase [Dehalococcoidales bacterium]|nr:L-seryl-tRNA(Sec) selenium transferase [Dehalococcoidales bacterium]
MSTEFRKLPSVDQMLAHPQIAPLDAEYPRVYLVNLVRQQLEHSRRAIEAGKKCPTPDEIALALIRHIGEIVNPGLRPVINATGVILHTNLGRAPLSKEAISAMSAASHGYSNLEFDVAKGVRGSRQAHIEYLLCEVTGAEAGLVVNNNAAAVLLGLSALARRKEIIVSRGQAVEIGDSFRIPDVMRQSGAKLVEIGTTNCTYARDYENAITPSTAALLRVHSSNFKVVGFTNEITIEELVAVGNKHNLPVFDDLGSGCFLDTTVFGLAEEPMVQRSIAAGVALAFFSGDKLVGGPQTGIIVGKKQYIDKLRRHPLARAVRIDKTRLAGLIATMFQYFKGEAKNAIPIWQMISANLAEIDVRAQNWVAVTNGLAHIIDGESMVGGGSLPGGTLPTKLVAFGGTGKGNAAFVLKLSQALRNCPIPVIGRINDNVLLLDPRSVLPEEDESVTRALSDVTRHLK